MSSGYAEAVMGLLRACLKTKGPGMPSVNKATGSLPPSSALHTCSWRDTPRSASWVPLHEYTGNCCLRACLVIRVGGKHCLCPAYSDSSIPAPSVSFCTFLAHEYPDLVHKVIMINGGGPTALEPSLCSIFNMSTCVLHCLSPCLAWSFLK